MAVMSDAVYVGVVLALQAILIVYFALRRWRAPFAYRIGRAIYALGVPLAAYSVVMVFAGRPWYLWVGGLVYALWGLLGNKVDVGRPLQWYEPICPMPFNGYVVLYLVYQGFFLWSSITLWKPGWAIFAVLFLLATALNLVSRVAPEAEFVPGG
jgi:hypothetical protein